MPNAKKNLRITGSHLVCPKCLEVLLREDIEGFGRCPYCDYSFELSPAIEDFLLSPLVRQWVFHTRNQMPDETSL
jgi:acetyl-CoA carboxylase beta subunit